jgi:alkylhydroperoxidase family enzyme
MAPPTPYASTISISLPSEKEVEFLLGENYDEATMLNVLKMMAGTDDMYAPTIGFITALFLTTGVKPTVREMIMLRAAKVLNSPYEWQANIVLAKNVGLTVTEIDAAASDGPVSGIDPEYVLICKATDELSMKATLTDETLASLLETYGMTVSRKVILIIGWFNLLARFLNGCRVPLEVTDKIGSGRSPIARSA